MPRHRLTLTLALAACACAYAPSARGQQPGAFNPLELFLMLDVDNDTVITRAEVPESGREAFDRLVKLGDTNKDGKIDREEYRALLERARDAIGPAGGGERFRLMDKNNDGKLSREEFLGAPPLFDRIDTNKDGQITRDEATAFAASNAPNQFGPRFRKMDRNNDGKVSRDEFTGPLPLFNRIDADKDGSITPAEVRRFQTGAAAKKAAGKAAEKAKDDGK